MSPSIPYFLSLAVLFADASIQSQLSDHDETTADTDAGIAPYTLSNMLYVPNNAHFQRTKSVQYLLDSIELAWSHHYPQSYPAENPYVHCVTSFSWLESNDTLATYSVAVQQYLRTNSLYSDEFIRSVADKKVISDENNGNISAINGQLGLVATQHIAENQCIAHYYGDEYLVEEFDIKMAAESANAAKWDYVMEVDYKGWSYEFLNVSARISIDGYHDEPEKEVLASLVNDCREDMSVRNITKQDEERRNTEFVYCAINGQLQPFLISTKEIQAGQQLFTYYGPSYVREYGTPPDVKDDL